MSTVMKLRIKGNSLRIRVTQSELREFDEKGSVQDAVNFGGGRALVYRLSRAPGNQELSATYNADVIEVRVPEAAARQWCSTDLVTLSGTQSRDGVELRLVVEKDFACLKPREGEDESDNFPHPDPSRC